MTDICDVSISSRERVIEGSSIRSSQGRRKETVSAVGRPHYLDRKASPGLPYYYVSSTNSTFSHLEINQNSIHSKYPLTYPRYYIFRQPPPPSQIQKSPENSEHENNNTTPIRNAWRLFQLAGTASAMPVTPRYEIQDTHSFNLWGTVW